MQRWLRWWFFPVLILCGSGCDEEIRMVLPGDPVPVVYGVFDATDTVHAVKLTKSFAGESDVYEMSKQSDLVFYQDPVIFLSAPGVSNRAYFTRISDVPREPGDFPVLPNEYYSLTRKLNPGNYQLTILLNGLLDTLTARFSVIGELKVLQPRYGLKRFYFYEDPTLFSWERHSGAGLYDISFSLTYQEYLKSGAFSTRILTHSRQLKPESLEQEGEHLNYRYFSEPFFAYIASQVKRDNEVDYRKAVNLEIQITAADTTLSRYIDWYEMEIDDRINPNGNIPGAIGVIGSKYTVCFPGLALSGRSQDSLVRGRYTANLEFVANSEWQSP